jgi:hypothetical protein
MRYSTKIAVILIIRMKETSIGEDVGWGDWDPGGNSLVVLQRAKHGLTM